MIFKELIQTNTWEAISSLLLEIYPDTEKDMEGYRLVFEKLKVMNPKKSDISIFISKEVDEDEEYMDVSGLYNNPKNEKEKYPQAIELKAWQKWLGMNMSNESLEDFSESEIIVHCLYEMTVVGFSEEDILKANKRIKKCRKDFELMTGTERNQNTTAVEEILKKWNEDKNKDD